MSQCAEYNPWKDILHQEVDISRYNYRLQDGIRKIKSIFRPNFLIIKTNTKLAIFYGSIVKYLYYITLYTHSTEVHVQFVLNTLNDFFRFPLPPNFSPPFHACSQLFQLLYFIHFSFYSLSQFIFFFFILASRFLVNLNCFLIYWIISQEEGSVFKQLALFYHFLYIYIYIQ